MSNSMSGPGLNLGGEANSHGADKWFALGRELARKTKSHHTHQLEFFVWIYQESVEEFDEDSFRAGWLSVTVLDQQTAKRRDRRYRLPNPTFIFPEGTGRYGH